VNPNVEESCFPDSVFNQTEPAVIVQGEWLTDKKFVTLLRSSWESQYADYLGIEAAESLVRQLTANREIYEHYAPLTLQATVDGQMVGIAALRPLEGISLVTMLEVIPANQGQGIGQQLIKALGSASEKLLTHVSIHRPAVAAFYSSLGFHLLDRTTLDHYGHQLEFDVMATS
jgi:N-acetylglutamate synthase-like GNAT family acetyltransferase